MPKRLGRGKGSGKGYKIWYLERLQQEVWRVRILELEVESMWDSKEDKLHCKKDFQSMVGLLESKKYIIKASKIVF